VTGETVDATFYVQIEPEWQRSYAHDPEVRSAKMARATLTRVTPKTGTVNVKLTVRLPKAAFHPLRPEAVIEIPMELIQASPVEVIASDPSS
jgi:hypothetical protein